MNARNGAGAAAWATWSFVTDAGSVCDAAQHGTVNVVDIQRLIGESFGQLPAVDDLNHDGVVNALDLRMALNAALGMGCASP